MRRKHIQYCEWRMRKTPAKAEKVYLCGCKMTKNPPFCDGTHKNIDE